MCIASAFAVQAVQRTTGVDRVRTKEESALWCEKRPPVPVRLAVLLALAAGIAAPNALASANPQHAGVQVALRALGLYCGPIDGDVGPLTVAAVRAAQQHAGLPVTGRIDLRTRRSLGPLGTPLFGARTMRRGQFGLDVAALQFLLAKRGAYAGAVDGYLGPQTAAAVRRYQRRTGLHADGLVGPSTRAALIGQTPAQPASAQAWSVYVVRPGDSLTAVAGRFGLSLAQLARINRLDASGVLLIGAQLRIPAGPEAVSLEATPETVRERLTTWAGRLGVSPSLVRALAWQESGFQPKVVSNVGAQGVLQVLPETRQFVEEVLVGRPLPRTLDGDIEVGVRHLRHLLDRFDGDTRLALAAWYQGERAVRRHGLYQVTEPFVANVLALASRM
jgi:peptidoglycan hydrolase-like protein with peptidoglycan-binding domain